MAPIAWLDVRRLAVLLVALVPACGGDDGDRGEDTSTTGMTSATASATATTTSTSTGTTSAADGSTGTGETTSGEATVGETAADSTSATDETAGSDDVGTTGDGLGDCCTVHGTPGCSIPEIQDCVCIVDAPCCVNGWDMTCVGEVEKLRCADCTP